MLKIVITTINGTDSSVKSWQNLGDLLIVPDEKTPGELFTSQIGRIVYKSSPLAGALPKNHYARKNLGYLKAMEEGASVIYDTDDDNYPLPNFKVREKECLARLAYSGSEWANVYNAFKGLSDPRIWPRGLPHSEIESGFTAGRDHCVAPIQQGLANGSPDVDAVWRLADGRETLFSTSAQSVRVRSWCPFNSQSTWWWPEAYPLMYLPSTCSMRVCDILRSYVAQRIQEEPIVFHAPEVIQYRNEHDLIDDLKQELPLYDGAEKIREGLESLDLTESYTSNLRACYHWLASHGFVQPIELGLLELWISEIHDNTTTRDYKG